MSDHHHFTPDMQNLKQPNLFNTDPSCTMEIMNLINPTTYFDHFPTLNFQSSSIPYSPEPNFLSPDEFPGNFSQHCFSGNPLLQNEKKIVPNNQTPESSSLTHSSPPASQNAASKRKNCGGRRKRKQRGEEEEEEEDKPREVVHVRAKRGQATDSHSLAERVRRGKINERLKCLQEIVPGCYKTMGMAVMLDEIINYVQSLQNQVEFLSMKLTAASSYHDCNSEIENIRTMQRAKACEGLKMQKLLREGCEGLATSNQFIPFDHNFGSCFSSLPHNT